MASLRDAAKVTEEIEGLLGRLKSELDGGNADLDRLARISDEISERADGLAETFENINEVLMSRLGQARRGGGQGSSGSRGGSRQKARSGR